MFATSTLAERDIRVVIADDHPIVRAGIVRELQRSAGIEVVGEASDGEEALAAAYQYLPDVLLLDINMPKLSGLKVLEQLEKTPPKAFVRALILSAYSDPQYVYTAFAAGAKGYLLKDELPNQIVRGVFAVAQDLPVLSSVVQQVLIRTRRETAAETLSQREIEVVTFVAQGLTNAEVGKRLQISHNTIKNHVTNIFGKLPNVRSRAELVAWAWQNQVVKSSDL